MKFNIITLGCKVNSYESNFMKEALVKNGFSFCNLNEKCDILILNTCTVTDTSDKKSLKEVRRLKRENPNAILVVCGCSVQNDKTKYDDLGINILMGNINKSNIVSIIEKYLDDKMTDFSFETTQLLKCYLNLETDINESYQKLKNKIESLEKDEGRAKIILENKLQEVYSELNKEYPWLNKYIYLSEDKLEDFMNLAYLFIRHNLLLLGNNHYVRSIALMVIAKVEEKLAQEDIAATLFLSKNYIGELFKMETGRNLKDYIADIKVARAKVLLFEGSHKWYEIANMLSYSNVEYFAGLFKKKVGLTPKEFKESGKFLIL